MKRSRRLVWSVAAVVLTGCNASFKSPITLPFGCTVTTVLKGGTITVRTSPGCPGGERP